MSDIKSDIVQELQKSIERMVKADIEQAWDEQKEKFIQRLEMEKAKSVAAISLRLMKQVDMQTMGDRVVITIRTEQ